MNSLRKLIKFAAEHLRVPKPKETLSARSLYLFKRDNRVRKAIHWVVSSWIFEYFILASILTSCVMVKSSGDETKSDSSSIYDIIDIVMNVIFTLEALLKIVTYGFFMHGGSYMRNKWNVVDFTILVGGLISDLIMMYNDSEKSVSIKVMRLFRVLRPLRLIVRYDSLKVVLDTILVSFKTLIHVLSFLLLIMIMYAITGIELFKGIFQTMCVDDNNGTITLLEPFTYCDLDDDSACLKFGNATCKDGVYDPVSSVSFDSIGPALLTVLQIITMEDWMFMAYDVVSVHYAVITYAYFISLVFIGGYLATGLLMGVLGNEFLKVKLFRNRQSLLEKAKRANGDEKKPLTR